MSEAAALDLSQPLVLNPDVELAPVGAFPKDIRRRLGGSETDFILSERGSRLRSQRIDAETAAFLGLFREPLLLVNAVAAHARAHDADPYEVLEDAVPLVMSLRLNGLVVDPTELQRRAMSAEFAPGAVVDGLRVIRRARKLTDTVVYRAELPDGTAVALKSVRAGAPGFVREALAHEWAVLEAAHGRSGNCVPRPVRAVLDREDPYVVVEWCDGRPVDTVGRDAAVGLQARGGIAVNLVRAYERLHGVGVLHGDIQPNNVLVDDRGEVSLVDFGGATLLPDRAAPRRMGLLPHCEPELAEAYLADRPPPPATEFGEQYCVGVLVYLLLTGHMYLPLPLESALALRQIVTQPPRPFANMGLFWPQVERVLRRALAKDPADRHQSFGAFADTLVEAVARSAPKRAPEPTPQQASLPVEGRLAAFDRAATQLADRYGTTAKRTRTGLRQGPSASLYYGAAGISWALLRLACIRDAPEVLAASDLWVQRALEGAAREDAFVGVEIGLLQGMTGPCSLFNGEPGLHAVAALVRHAAGDAAGCHEAVHGFVTAARCLPDGPEAERFALDAANGAAGLLLGAALLLPPCRVSVDAPLAELQACGVALRATVEAELAAAGSRRLLGLAHGRAGALLALLRWAEAAEAEPSPAVEACLEELAALAVRQGLECAWPIAEGVPGSPSWGGWCHGSAGHVLLWSAAARAYDRHDYRFLAVGAGEHVWRGADELGPSLCCGLAGQALALFELARLTGDDVWRDRGRELAGRGLARAVPKTSPHSLFRGQVGILLAATEARDPTASRWPVCQSPL